MTTAGATTAVATTPELDQPTLERARRGDPDAARALIEHYQRDVFALLSQSPGARGAVDALAEETFVEVLRGLDAFGAVAPVRMSTWIAAVAARRAARHEARTDHADEPEASASSADAARVPAGFASRVLAARGAPVLAPPRRSSRLVVVAAAVVGAACAVAIAIALVRGVGAVEATTVGELRATGRQSAAIARRGIAVAEDGAALSWRVAGGAAWVEQRAGRVFYRVDAGGPFTVVAAGDEIRAGTACFTVELAPAAITVHQGEVVIAADGRSRRIAAGERADLGRDPRRP